jgi:hypothetical protein
MLENYWMHAKRRIHAFAYSRAPSDDVALASSFLPPPLTVGMAK